jgi:hypothetical protein
VSRPTWGSRSPRVSFRLRGFHPLWPDFPDRFSYESLVLPRPLNPAALTCDGLASSAFARHYLRNHYCFLFLRVLRCFTSPGSPPTPMYSALDNAELPALGFPIRRSPDQSLVDGSPRLFAATHVLHRLSAPRHPPHALSSLVTRSSFSRNAAVWCGSRPRSRSTSTWTRACSRMRLLNLEIECAFLRMRFSESISRTRLENDCGAERNRTDDVLLAKQVLYQLSYSPVRFEPSLAIPVPPPTARHPRTAGQTGGHR